MKSSEIRQAFIDFFAKKNHHVVDSSTLVPVNDSSLLFTNAGMVQFKDIFLGLEKRAYTRAVSAQCCVRAGGKHNDLENVGYTARHHTFFEMLGNFSFGDYFKREAIHYAWEFLTKVLALPPERLWVTVYKEDEEAAAIWLNEIGVSASRLSRCGDADNFWSMGETGPCGPCTEIFYDHGPSIAGGPPGTPDAEGDRYIEIWNLVFMQFNRDKNGQLHSLPAPSVDTGMGLERITAVIQGVHNNYHIDSFKTLIDALMALGVSVDREHASLKVIADHIRACSFLIAEGVLPSNEGRGYVLRRIVRRAVRHGYQLGFSSPFFYKLVSSLVDVMGDAYPLLQEKQVCIEDALRQEERQFARTLEQGMGLLEEAIRTLKTNTIGGEVAFKLYDTYGFPLDLTMDIAREKGLHVDVEGFEHCMRLQRQQSQLSSQFQVDYDETDSLGVVSVFEGYSQNMLQSEVMVIRVDGVTVEKVTAESHASIVLKETPFYAESGGQVGDKGQLLGKDMLFRVDDTQNRGEAIVHHGVLLKGTIQVGQPITACIDTEWREAIRLNHSATHLLHAALKIVLGPQVQQKGSLVDATRARFDFSHSEGLNRETLLALETWVNDKIRANEDVVTTHMEIEAAKKSGAQALFGEKYGETVRVLSMGDFSKELCGGTHVKRTGDIGLFKIITEYGVASGVRRIEMVTGRYALQWVNEQLSLLETMVTALKTTVAQGPEKLLQALSIQKQQEKQLSELKHLMALQSGRELEKDVEWVDGMNLLVKRLQNVDLATLRPLLDQLKSRLEPAVIVLVAEGEHKIHVVAGISKTLTGRVPSATTLVRHLCGQGGGRDDMAQGGSAMPADLELKIAALITMVKKAVQGAL